MTLSIKKLKAIDVHAHIGEYNFTQSELFDSWCSADHKIVTDRARRANTQWTLVSPLAAFMPPPGDSFSANENVREIINSTQGLMQWAVLDPVRDNFVQVAEILKSPKCIGIKIHPRLHNYHISEYGKKIFEFASENKAVIQTHSGDELAMPIDFVPFADSFPEVKLIVAHLGYGSNEDPTLQVRSIQAAKNGNIYTDTSSSMSLCSGLIEWAVKEVGPEHILYGTDSPCYFPAAQRVRIDEAEIEEKDKQLILCDNAIKLFSNKLNM